MPSKTSLLLLVFLGSVWTARSAETVLYQTDFSEFELGDDALVGNDGWQSSHPGQGVHGTIDDVFEAGNRSGTLGFNLPGEETEVVTLWRSVNRDPLASDRLIHFSTEMAIIDSDNEAYDSFYFSIFNQEDDLLASVVFDNSADAFGVWRYDSNAFHDLSQGYDHATRYQLSLTIDYTANQWSGWLDDLSLFENVPFTESEEVRNLGDVAVEWELSDVDNPGTNWVYFDDWTLRESDRVQAPPQEDALWLPEIVRLPNGRIRLAWEAAAGETFVVERSADLMEWEVAGRNAEVRSDDAGWARFVDRSSGGASALYYRIRRS